MVVDDTGQLPILALNAGSSSLKFGLHSVGCTSSRPLLSGAAEVGGDGIYGAFSLRDGDGAALPAETAADVSGGVIDRIAGLLTRHDLPSPVAIGHRIVHAGPHCRRHVLIDATVMQHLQAAMPFAPLHLPPALALLALARKRFPDVPHAACLDSAFHADMPPEARTLPIPRWLREQGLERYGFHGLSCDSVVRQLGAALPARLVIAHLGNGASVTAVAHGRSVDTSMGLTPAGGLVMSTRCGDIDPGVLAHVIRELGVDADGVEALIHHQSGLLGVSGSSGDMRQLRRVEHSDPDARLAIAMFCLSARKHIAAMAAVLGGVDVLVFTGGIGENDAQTRASIRDGLGGFGIGDAIVVPSNEAEAIARITGRLVSPFDSPPASS